VSKSPRALRYPTTQDMPVGMQGLLSKQEAERALNGQTAAAAPAYTQVPKYLQPKAPGKAGGGRHQVQRAPGEMNKTEKSYAEQLEALRTAGVVAWWGFEKVKLRLAPKTHLTMDFVVVLASGAIEAVDVKGRKGDRYWAEEDAKVKLKVAATMFPWLRFYVAWPAQGGGWNREAIPA
jgi:hypothetical protein